MPPNTAVNPPLQALDFRENLHVAQTKARYSALNEDVLEEDEVCDEQVSEEEEVMEKVMVEQARTQVPFLREDGELDMRRKRVARPLKTLACLRIGEL